MKTLVIAPQPFFSPRGTPMSVYYRSLVTAELGVDIDLLTYGEGADAAIDGVRIIRIPRFGLLGEVKVGPSLLKLVLDMFLVSWTIALLLRHRYHIVHAHEEAVFFCWILKPIFRFKLVYDMHSSLPEQLTNFRFTKSKLLIGAFERLERASLRAADGVITISPYLADYALSLLDDPGKHFLIENSIFEDVKLVGSTERKNLSKNDGRPGDRSGEHQEIVFYAGTLETYQGIDVLIQAFQKVHERIPNSLLMIVGGSKIQIDHYADLARTAGVAHCCRFTGRVPQPKVKHLRAGASVQVSPRLHGTNTPLKLYEQLASGLPLVATSIPAHTQVLDETVAFLASPEPGAFADAIIQALTDDVSRIERSNAARRLYAERYSRDVYVEKMRGLLERVG